MVSQTRHMHWFCANSVTEQEGFLSITSYRHISELERSQPGTVSDAGKKTDGQPMLIQANIPAG